MLTRPAPRSRARRGITLAEMVVTLSLLGVMGTMFVKVLVTQGQTFTRQQASRSARASSRVALNLLLSDLRMVQEGTGVRTASASKLELWVPFSVGIVCGHATGPDLGDVTVASFPPMEEGGFTHISATHFQIRGANGEYGTVWTPSQPSIQTAVDKTQRTPTAADSTLVTENSYNQYCLRQGDLTVGKDSIRLDKLKLGGAMGRIIALRPQVATARRGVPVILLRAITYEFKPSTKFGNGALGLFRTVAGTAVGEEEVMAPFDASARFRFFYGSSDTSYVAPPSPLSSLRGIEVALTAAPTTGPTAAKIAKTPMTTAVFFQNVRTF